MAQNIMKTSTVKKDVYEPGKTSLQGLMTRIIFTLYPEIKKAVPRKKNATLNLLACTVPRLEHLSGATSGRRSQQPISGV